MFEYPRSPSATRSRASTPTTSSRAVAILQLPLPAGPLARAQHRVRGSAARSDEFVVDDFVLTTGSVDVVSRMKFKEWAQFEAIETLQNKDVSAALRVGEAS